MSWDPRAFPNPPTLPKLLPLPAVFVVLITSCVLVSFATSYVWAQQYAGRIAPNVQIGSIAVGGLDAETAADQVQKRVDELLTNGVMIELEKETATLPLATVV